MGVSRSCKCCFRLLHVAVSKHGSPPSPDRVPISYRARLTRDHIAAQTFREVSIPVSLPYEKGSWTDGQHLSVRQGPAESFCSPKVGQGPLDTLLLQSARGGTERSSRMGIYNHLVNKRPGGTRWTPRSAQMGRAVSRGEDERDWTVRLTFALVYPSYSRGTRGSCGQ